jgi:hypothetical protein
MKYMKDININARIPEVARSRVKTALGYRAKIEDESGVEIDNPQTEEQFITKEIKSIINEHLNKRIRRQAEAELEYSKVNIDVTLS